MIRIIAIEREYGCGGSVVAAKLAERLGWKLMDQQITQEIARLAKVTPATVERREQKLDPLFYRLAKVFWRGSYERSLPVDGLEAFDADRLVALMQRVIDDAAAAGNCVIVSRGAPYFLRNRTDLLAAFLFAPRDYKVKFVTGLGKSEKEAAELVDTIDHERASFIKHYFQKEWPHRSLYHLMFNTALGEELAITTILNLMEALNKREASS
ncbi:MAG TPA: cytidylate kinase-like family protein [Verrucomicrobiae bacterium]|nr:cytidylate kinase-like family protein [Verrucomicrobiae bacterium]